MQKLLRRLVDTMRMVREDAQAVARVVEEAFQGRSELDDETLQKEVRQVFYDLQDRNILEIRRAESQDTGQLRRHYYWRLREDTQGAGPELPVPDAAERLYHRLGDDAWERRPAHE